MRTSRDDNIALALIEYVEQYGLFWTKECSEQTWLEYLERPKQMLECLKEICRHYESGKPINEYHAGLSAHVTKSVRQKEMKVPL